MSCPSFEVLMDYCQGLLNDDDSRVVAAHLASGCKECEDIQHWYERVRSLAERDISVPPPPWVLKRAVRLFHSTRLRLAALEKIDGVIASLIFDSRSQPAPGGARIAEISDRQLLYRAGDYSIDLQIILSDQSSADLIGQVLREGEFRFESVGKLTLELTRDGEKISSAVTDNVGKFTMNRIQCGVYELLIETREGIIRVPQLSVTQS
jgi:hypothetical protein